MGVILHPSTKRISKFIQFPNPNLGCSKAYPTNKKCPEGLAWFSCASLSRPSLEASRKLAPGSVTFEEFLLGELVSTILLLVVVDSCSFDWLCWLCWLLPFFGCFGDFFGVIWFVNWCSGWFCVFLCQAMFCRATSQFEKGKGACEACYAWRWLWRKDFMSFRPVALQERAANGASAKRETSGDGQK